MTRGSPPTAQILIVEDDEHIRQFLTTTLNAEGYGVLAAANRREGETLSANRRVDAFLIDLGLPDGDGADLIRHLRSWTQRPIIVLSARSQEDQKVAALDAGADDYITKPFGSAELHARIRVALRHAYQTSLSGRSVLRAGDVSIDLESKTVKRGGQTVRLTATQWRFLEVLSRHAGRVVGSSQLLKEVWGPGHAEQGHYLRIYVRQLRQKLEAVPAKPQYLLTETGIGYRLVVDAHSGHPDAGPAALQAQSDEAGSAPGRGR